MNEIKKFYFRDQKVRGLLREGEPWFVAKDVCSVLDIGKYRDAISTLDDDERGSVVVDTPGGPQSMTIISESGLYALVFKSRKPEAKVFRKWVTTEVLPELRKRGYYAQPEMAGRQTHIYHHRGPQSESGLDICYTMDLTKLALNPTAQSLAVVQRLTGVDMDDLVEELQCAKKAYQEEEVLVREFMQECCEENPGNRLYAADLYKVFCRWHVEKWGTRACYANNSFGRRMKKSGYEPQTDGNRGKYYLDLTINAAWRNLGHEGSDPCKS